MSFNLLPNEVSSDSGLFSDGRFRGSDARGLTGRAKDTAGGVVKKLPWRQVGRGGVLAAIGLGGREAAHIAEPVTRGDNWYGNAISDISRMPFDSPDPATRLLTSLPLRGAQALQGDFNSAFAGTSQSLPENPGALEKAVGSHGGGWIDDFLSGSLFGLGGSEEEPAPTMKDTSTSNQGAGPYERAFESVVPDYSRQDRRFDEVERGLSPVYSDYSGAMGQLQDMADGMNFEATDYSQALSSLEGRAHRINNNYARAAEQLMGMYDLAETEGERAQLEFAMEDLANQRDAAMGSVNMVYDDATGEVAGYRGQAEERASQVGQETMDLYSQAADQIAQERAAQGAADRATYGGIDGAGTSALSYADLAVPETARAGAREGAFNQGLAGLHVNDLGWLGGVMEGQRAASLAEAGRISDRAANQFRSEHMNRVNSRIMQERQQLAGQMGALQMDQLGAHNQLGAEETGLYSSQAEANAAAQNMHQQALNDIGMAGADVLGREADSNAAADRHYQDARTGVGMSRAEAEGRRTDTQTQLDVEERNARRSAEAIATMPDLNHTPVTLVSTSDEFPNATLTEVDLRAIAQWAVGEYATGMSGPDNAILSALAHFGLLEQYRASDARSRNELEAQITQYFRS